MSQFDGNKNLIFKSSFQVIIRSLQILVFEKKKLDLDFENVSLEKKNWISRLDILQCIFCWLSHTYPIS